VPGSKIPTGIDFAAELNPEQFAAVTAPPGPALVIAGAGSGKTRALTYRVAWLLEQGVPPYGILLLTFTNKAAREMIERVQNLVASGADGLWSGTFHSIGNRILRTHAEDAGFPRNFTIMDREDSEDMIAAVIAEANIVTTGCKFPKAGVLSDIFSYATNTAEPLRAVLAAKYRYFLPLVEDIVKVQSAYESRKRDAGSMDFDDLLSKTHALFLERPDIAAAYQRRFRHILVDEYQDTNRLQSELIDILAAGHGNIMAVGDDAQSIYSWRGANFENILNFPEKRPGTRVFKIETNYRSVPGVLDLANAAIQGNTNQFPKNLAPSRASAPLKPILSVLPTNTAQAAHIARRVMELIEDGMPPSEIAILYRAHYHSMEIQIEFTKCGIPFTVTSGLRFFEQAHVKDLAAFLKLALNPRDETAFKRLVRMIPGIGLKTSDSLWQSVSTTLSGRPAFGELAGIKVPAKARADWTQLVHTLSELVPVDGTPLPTGDMIRCVLFAIYDDYMRLKFSNYEARREDLETLETFASQFESTGDFLSQLALLGGVDTPASMQDRDGKVVLSTLHQAKGLEWRVVFLIWLSEGMFPSLRCIEHPESLEEERRLFYVGITRCMDELHLTYPEMRLGSGYANAFQPPSRFLRELPEHLFEAFDHMVSPTYGNDSRDDENPF
jgi:DNA helicase II / ATP-dependent DNA helicase PcrA